MKSAIYPLVVMITFVIATAIMKNALDINGGAAFGFTIVIMGFAVISDIIRKKHEHKKVGRKESSQIQADLNELKKNVAEIREYVTDLYIQQHDQKLEQKLNLQETEQQ